jgi:hypothetical protein
MRSIARRRHAHRAQWIALAFAGVIVMAISPTSPAHATQLEVTCIGTQHVKISPGLSFVPKDVTLTVNTIYAPCKSPSVPGVTSATNKASFPIPGASCLNPFDPGSGTKNLNWNTGQTSTFSFNRIGSNVGGTNVIISTGTITNGLFAGATALETVVGPSLDILKCLMEPGITDRYTTVTLQISSP